MSKLYLFFFILRFSGNHRDTPRTYCACRLFFLGPLVSPTFARHGLAAERADEAARMPVSALEGDEPSQILFINEKPSQIILLMRKYNDMPIGLIDNKLQCKFSSGKKTNTMST